MRSYLFSFIIGFKKNSFQMRDSDLFYLVLKSYPVKKFQILFYLDSDPPNWLDVSGRE
jgi:hypothetical protein